MTRCMFTILIYLLSAAICLSVGDDRSPVMEPPEGPGPR